MVDKPEIDIAEAQKVLSKVIYDNIVDSIKAAAKVKFENVLVNHIPKEK